MIRIPKYKTKEDNVKRSFGILNPRTAGGGRMTAAPQRTRKLRKIATSGKRRWIGRGKFYIKYLDHF